MIPFYSRRNHALSLHPDKKMSPPITTPPPVWHTLLSTIDAIPPCLPELLWALYQLSKTLDCAYLRPRPIRGSITDAVISAVIINRYPAYQWLVRGKTFGTGVVVLWIGGYLVVVALIGMAERARRRNEK